jgi:hypothetical protein
MRQRCNDEVGKMTAAERRIIWRDHLYQRFMRQRCNDEVGKMTAPGGGAACIAGATLARGAAVAFS